MPQLSSEAIPASTRTRQIRALRPGHLLPKLPGRPALTHRPPTHNTSTKQENKKALPIVGLTEQHHKRVSLSTHIPRHDVCPSRPLRPQRKPRNLDYYKSNNRDGRHEKAPDRKLPARTHGRTRTHAPTGARAKPRYRSPNAKRRGPLSPGDPTSSNEL